MPSELQDRAPAGNEEVADNTYPSAPEELTLEWLTRALALSGGRVSSIKVNPIGSGQGMTGELARVSLEYEGAPRGAPRSLIAKFPSRDGPTRALTERFQLQRREAGFYRELASQAGVPSPRAYYSDAPKGDGAVLLLEDLTEARVGDLRAGCTLEEAHSLVRHLARMHSKWWGNTELDDMEWLPWPNDPTTLDYAEAVAPEAWNSFRRKAGRLPPVVAELGSRLANDHSGLIQLGSAPRTLVHGDMRVNNVLWDEDGSVRAIIDWQTVMAGKGVIDVASLFVNCLSPEDRRVGEAELLPEYYEALVGAGVERYSFDECWKDYRLAVMNQFSQVVAISSLIDLDNGLDDGVSAATGARMFAALMELDLLELAPPLPRWRRWLSRARSIIRP